MMIPFIKTCATSIGVLGVIFANAQENPNIIVILMDDMGYGDIASNGAINYPTPNFDRLQKEGMTFTHYYSPQAVSGASRAGLLTGCYPNRFGFYGAPYPGFKGGLHEQEMTMAEVLKQKDYQCAIFGKWHLGNLPEFLPTNHGFDEFYGIPYSNDMWPNHPTMKFPDLPLFEGDQIVELNPDQTQLTTDFTHRALKFISKNKENPFFLYLAHPMPHVPLFVSDKFKGKSEQGLFGDVMMELDWSLGEIIKKLEREELDQNTLIIVTSDNGPWLNYGNHAGSTSGLREGKGTSFEGGQRVPCIMRWKGQIQPGIICSNLVTGLDILPTVAHITDATLPPLKIDGVNLMPLLEQKENANPRESFCYYYRQNDLEAVTDGTFKLVFPHKHRTYESFVPGNDGAPGKVEEYHVFADLQLFDLRRDPGERYNVIAQHPEVVEKLKKIAQDTREDIGDNLTKTKGKNNRPLGRIAN